MDLNYLFLRQQVERSRARAAASDEARKAHEDMAREYEREIERQSGGRIHFMLDGTGTALAPPR
jgi:hypothetical protein